MRLFELPTESKNLIQVTSASTGAYLEILDTNHDGVLDAQEFAALGVTEENFKKIDQNGDGLVDVHELDSTTQAMDTNHDGELDAQEFAALGVTKENLKKLDQNGSVEVAELTALEWSIKTESEQYSGCFSPMCKVTLPPAMLERLGIPGDSTHFCFAYSDNKVQTRNSEMEPGLEQMVRRGGFCYFQARDQGSSWQVTSIKAITDSSTKGLQDISFAGWEVVPDHVVKLMETGNKRRFAPSTLLSAKLQTMGERGFAKVAWISPSEDIGGNVFQYGGFMYKFRDGSKPVVVHVSKVAKAQKNHMASNPLNMSGDSLPSAVGANIRDESRPSGNDNVNNKEMRRESNSTSGLSNEPNPGHNNWFLSCGRQLQCGCSADDQH